MIGTTPAVFLDRDGVLVRSEMREGKAFAVRSVDAFRLLPGSADSVRRLKAAGYLVVVVTNQPDIGNGLIAADVVEAMHTLLRRRTAVDDIRCCPHAQNVGCNCRKPRPGMLLQAAQTLNIDLARSWMVGDRSSDVTAGHAAGCRTIFINRGYREAPPSSADATVRTLPAAVSFILGNS